MRVHDTSNCNRNKPKWILCGFFVQNDGHTHTKTLFENPKCLCANHVSNTEKRTIRVKETIRGRIKHHENSKISQFELLLQNKQMRRKTFVLVDYCVGPESNLLLFVSCIFWKIYIIFSTYLSSFCLSANQFAGPIVFHLNNSMAIGILNILKPMQTRHNNTLKTDESSVPKATMKYNNKQNLCLCFCLRNFGVKSEEEVKKKNTHTKRASRKLCLLPVLISVHRVFFPVLHLFKPFYTVCLFYSLIHYSKTCAS